MNPCIQILHNLKNSPAVVYSKELVLEINIQVFSFILARLPYMSLFYPPL